MPIVRRHRRYKLIIRGRLCESISLGELGTVGGMSFPVPNAKILSLMLTLEFLVRIGLDNPPPLFRRRLASIFGVPFTDLGIVRGALLCERVLLRFVDKVIIGHGCRR